MTDKQRAETAERNLDDLARAARRLVHRLAQLSKFDPATAVLLRAADVQIKGLRAALARLASEGGGGK